MEKVQINGPKPAQYDAIKMVEVKETGEMKMRPDSPYKMSAQRYSGLNQNMHKKL